MNTPLKQHPTAKIIPPMSKGEFQELKEDIKLQGLLNPIVLYEGMILDGNHRYQACTELNIEPKFVDFTNTVISDLEFVISQNLKRRHLNTGQRADLAIAVEKLLIKQRRNFAHGRNGHTPKHLLTGIQKDKWSSQVAGKLLSVSHGSISYAKLVEKRRPDLMEKVRSGEMKLGKAYSIVKDPPRPRGEQIDKIARKVLNELDFQDYEKPKSIHVTDFEMWQFERYISSKGYDLSLSRTGNTWDAIFVKNCGKPSIGHTSWKAAMLDAGNKILEKLENKE